MNVKCSARLKKVNFTDWVKQWKSLLFSNRQIVFKQYSKLEISIILSSKSLNNYIRIYIYSKCRDVLTLGITRTIAWAANFVEWQNFEQIFGFFLKKKIIVYVNYYIFKNLYILIIYTAMDLDCRGGGGKKYLPWATKI